LKKYIKSIPIKGVTSTSYAKGNDESRTNEQSHNSHWYLPLHYVHVASRPQRYKWTKVDTVRIGK